MDPLNACILLMKLECKRFSKQRAKAGSSDSFLTPRGTVEYEEVFEGINALDFTITIVSQNKSYECTVRQNMMSSRHLMGKMVVLKQPVKGSFFGTCTCGVDKRDSIPCKHMAALLVSARIPDIARHNIMPYWWTTDQWKRQFPLDTVANSNTNMAMIHDDHEPSGNYRYCPDWSAPNKAGRPKKNERRKSVLETAGGTRGKKAAKRMTVFCQVCISISHATNNCWELEKNCKLRPAKWKSKLQGGFDITNDETEVAVDKSVGGEGGVLEVEGGTVD